MFMFCSTVTILTQLFVSSRCRCFQPKIPDEPGEPAQNQTPESWHLDGPLLLHSVRSRLTCGHCCGLLAAQIWHHRCLRCWGVDTRPDDFFFISIKKCWGGQNRANGANIEPGFIKWTKWKVLFPQCFILSPSLLKRVLPLNCIFLTIKDAVNTSISSNNIKRNSNSLSLRLSPPKPENELHSSEPLIGKL